MVPLLSAISSRPTKIMFALVAAVGLSACAVINPPKPLPLPVAPKAPVTTLKDAGLAHPQTVWVPAFYTGGRDSLLFINGKRYRAPNGAGNVVGFIPTPTGYSVAVENVPSPAEITNSYGMPVGRIQRGARLEVFSVTETGKTLRELGSLRLRRATQVFQTKSAFYIQDLSGRVREGALGNQAQGVAPLFSYYGLNAEGHRVSGPTNVLFATPAPNGGWIEHILIGSNPITGIQYRILVVKDGQVLRSTAKGSTPFRAQPIFFHSLSAFVDLPPVVDSERTGMTLVAVHYYNPMSQGNVIVTNFGSVNPEYPAVGQPGQSIQMVPGQAIAFALREALFGTPGAPVIVRQMSNGVGPVYVGYKSMYHITKSTYHQTWTPVFPLVSGAASFAGILTGANAGGQEVVNAKVDAFTLLTPKGAVLINADGNQIGAGYALYAKAQIPSLDMQQFAAQYGLMP